MTDAPEHSSEVEHRVEFGSSGLAAGWQGSAHRGLSQIYEQSG